MIERPHVRSALSSVRRSCVRRRPLFGDKAMSTLPPKADIGRVRRDFRFVPNTDITVGSFDRVMTPTHQAGF
jgi:hypothetical protein